MKLSHAVLLWVWTTVPSSSHGFGTSYLDTIAATESVTKKQPPLSYAPSSRSTKSIQQPPSDSYLGSLVAPKEQTNRLNRVLRYLRSPGSSSPEEVSVSLRAAATGTASDVSASPTGGYLSSMSAGASTSTTSSVSAEPRLKRALNVLKGASSDVKAKAANNKTTPSAVSTPVSTLASKPPSRESLTVSKPPPSSEPLAANAGSTMDYLSAMSGSSVASSGPKKSYGPGGGGKFPPVSDTGFNSFLGGLSSGSDDGAKTKPRAVEKTEAFGLASPSSSAPRDSSRQSNGRFETSSALPYSKKSQSPSIVASSFEEDLLSSTLTSSFPERSYESSRLEKSSSKEEIMKGSSANLRDSFFDESDSRMFAGSSSSAPTFSRSSTPSGSLSSRTNSVELAKARAFPPSSIPKMTSAAPRFAESSGRQFKTVSTSGSSPFAQTFPASPSVETQNSMPTAPEQKFAASSTESSLTSLEASRRTSTGANTEQTSIRRDRRSGGLTMDGGGGNPGSTLRNGLDISPYRLGRSGGELKDFQKVTGTSPDGNVEVSIAINDDYAATKPITRANRLEDRFNALIQSRTNAPQPIKDSSAHRFRAIQNWGREKGRQLQKQELKRLRAPASLIADMSVHTPVQGGSLTTWSFTKPTIERVHVALSTEGRPLNADISLWRATDHVPYKIRIYSEDGCLRPFSAVIETPTGPNTVSVRNTGQLEFPMTAHVVPEEMTKGDSSRFLPAADSAEFKLDPLTIHGGALKTFVFDASVESVQILLESDGLPLNATIELLQGPTNSKQSMHIYSEDGLDRPFFMVVETPGGGNVVRVVNAAPIEFPLTASVEPYSIGQSFSHTEPIIGGDVIPHGEETMADGIVRRLYNYGRRRWSD